MNTRRIASLGVLVLLPPVVAALALQLGPSPVGWDDLLDVLRGDAALSTRQILLDVRLPRILLAAVVGAALSCAGAAFQAILRNPLADPYILGVSGGAGLGAVLFSSLAGTAVGSLGRPVAAFAGGMATLFVLFGLARARGRTGSTSLLLVGVVLNAFYSAVILFLMTRGDRQQFESALSFLVGWIHPPEPAMLVGVGALVLAGSGVLVLHAHRLNLLAFGDEAAETLGIRVERTIWIVLVAASVATAASVAFTGLIGFVGLIVPHLIRVGLGADHRVLLPASLFGGATFLIVADTLARTVTGQNEMPVGVVTALIGGPFFLALFLRQVRGGAS